MKKTGRTKETNSAGTNAARKKNVSRTSIPSKKDNRILKKTTAKKVALPDRITKQPKKAFTTEILGSFGICMWELDIATNNLFYADETYKLLGLKKTGKVTIKKMPGLFTKASSALLKQAINLAIDKGKSFDLELELPATKGKIKWVRAVCKSKRKNQKTTNLIGSFQDITKQKEVESDLSEREDKYRSLVENSLNAFFFGKPDGTALYANKAAVDMFGYSLEEFYNMNRQVFIDYKDPRVPGLIAKREKEGKVAGEVICIRKNGERFPCEFSSSIYTDRNGEKRTSTIFTDISEKKKAAREIDLLMSNAEEGFVLINKDLEIVKFNAKFERRSAEVFGKHAQKGDSIINYTQPERKEILKGIYKDVFAGKSMESEIEIPLPDGTKAAFLSKFRPATDEEGNIIGAFVTVTEFTKQKRAQQLLVESEKRFKALVENGNDAFVILNEKGFPVYASSSVIRVLGYTEEETLKTNLFSILHADHIKEIQQTIEECLVKPGVVISKPVARWLHKDGTWRWLEGTITNLLHDPVIGGIVDNFRDVTEKVETEKRIKEERLLFRTIIDNLPIIVYTKDLNSKKTLINRADYEYAGFTSEEEVLGKDDFELFSEESAKNTIAEDNFIFSTGKSIIGKEEHHIKKDGSDIWFLISKTPLKDEDGRITGLLGISYDISQRKKAEAKLAKKDEQLSLATQIARLGYWEEDFINKTGSWSDETYRIFGFEAGEIKASFDNFLAIVHPDDVEEIRRTIEESGKTLRTTPFTNRIIRKDGSVRTIYTESRLILDKQKKPVAIYGIHHDITEQKRAEEALKESKLSLEKAFDIARIGSWKYDIVNDRYEWTQSGIDVIGFTKENIPENWESFKKLIPKEHLSEFLSEIVKAQKTGVFDLEHRIVVNGNSKWVRAKSHIEYDIHGNALYSVGIIQDINDRKQIEQQLNDAYNFNQTILENSPVGKWIYDETGQAISVNRAAIELNGGATNELLKMNFKDIPSWRESGLYDAAVKSLASGQTVKKEIHIINSFGKELWFEALLTPIQFKGKKHLILMTYDIKDRMIAEKSLVESQKQLSLAMRIARLGYWEFDVREGLFTFNDQFYSMLKTDAEKAGGYKLSPQQYTEMFIHPDDQSIIEAEIEKGLTSADPNFSSYVEHRVTFGNGEPGYISVNFYIVKDDKGNTIKTYGVNQNITERKKAEEETRLAKERYELVARVTNDAIYEWDIVNHFNYWGEGLETLFGHKRTGDKMPEETWVDNLHPDEKDHLFAAAYEAFKNKTPSLTRELRFKCADGSYKTVFDKLVILYNKEGKPLKIVGAMQDITARKLNELSIKSLNDALNKRAKELADSNKELERFAYIASHDLQEPLRMVSSFLSLLEKKYQPQLDETASQYIRFAVDGADRMKQLIMDLLEYSRVGTSRDQLVETDMNEVVTQVLETFAGKIQETHACIKTASLPVIKANKMQVLQLIQNLVGNALKYNTSDIPKIEIGYVEKPGFWQFFVKDNGIGIDPKFFEKVFIIFQRLHNKNEFSGTGIGLAICKKIIEKHNGTIWIESKVDAGSTFFFTIKK